MKTILITGANGFVGSHALMAGVQHADVRWVAACRDRRKLPAGYRGEVRVGDLRDADDRKRLLEGVDVVIHAAAWSSLWGHRQQSRELYLEPALQLIDDCVAAGIERFVFVSSSSATSQVDRGDPYGAGVQPEFWPHLANVVRIENRLREVAANDMAAVNLRCGLFAGKNYGLGLLPILLPRLRTRLVPWVSGGKTSMPIVAGEDLGQACALAATVPGLRAYESFQIVGPEVPTARQVIEFLRAEFGYPAPLFSVPFPVGYAFAWLMEKLDPLVPWEPLVVRSIIHLLEETWPDNGPAMKELGYRPETGWKTAIRAQVAEMQVRQKTSMSMAVPVR